MASLCGCLDILLRKRAVLAVLFSDLSDSFAVLLNFRNFRDFCNKRFAVFRQVSQIVFRKFRKYEFRKVSQMLISQFYVCFARFARFLKYEFSQAFANTSFASFCK